MFIQGKSSLRRSVASRIVPFALLALVLSGCASTATDAEAEAPAPASSAAVQGSEAPAPEPTPTTAAECIVGTWVLDNASFSAAMKQIDASVSDTLTGTAQLTVAADHTAQTEYVNWKHVMEVSGQAGAVTIERNGVDYGTIVVTDDTLGLQETSNESVLVVSAGGMVLPSAPNEGSQLALGLFECEGDQLTISADGTTSFMHRAG